MEERTLQKLRVRREAANQKIQARIEAGQLLRERKIDSSDELENVREDFRTWSEYNERLLTHRRYRMNTRRNMALSKYMTMIHRSHSR